MQIKSLAFDGQYRINTYTAKEGAVSLNILLSESASSFVRVTYTLRIYLEKKALIAVFLFSIIKKTKSSEGVRRNYAVMKNFLTCGRGFYTVMKTSAVIGFAILFLLHTQILSQAEEKSTLADAADTGIQAGQPEYAQEYEMPDTADTDGWTKQPDETAENGMQPVFTDSQGVIYELYDNSTCYINGYEKQMPGSIVIPEKIYGADKSYTVKGIRETAFADCSGLQKIEIPDSVSDIGKHTFTDCTNLKNILIIPAKSTVKKSGTAVTAAFRINGVLAGAAEHVSLQVRGDLLKKAVSDKKADSVTILAAVTDEGSSTDALPGAVLEEDAVSALADSGKNLKITIKDASGRSYHMKASADRIKKVSGKLELDVKTSRIRQSGSSLELADLKDSTDSLLKSFRTDMKKALQKNSISAGRVKVLKFSFGSGAKLDMDVIFPAEGWESGTEVYVYRYDKNKRNFEPLFYHPPVVSKEGNLKISVSKGGIFAVSKKPFRSMSRKLAEQFLREFEKTYYIDQNGKAVCGWKKIGSEYYYFDRETGVMASSARIDGIKITGSGTAQKTDANVKKIQTMMKARAIVDQVTNASDSRSQKIEKCFRWIFQFPYKRYRRLQPIYRQAGWEVTFANDIFDNHQGCCVSEASAAAFLFHECGYPQVYVACDTSHAWVELNGRVYDPLFAEARGFSEYYNRSYDGYGMRPVLKRLI